MEKVRAENILVVANENIQVLNEEVKNCKDIVMGLEDKERKHMAMICGLEEELKRLIMERNALAEQKGKLSSAIERIYSISG